MIAYNTSGVFIFEKKQANFYLKMRQLKEMVCLFGLAPCEQIWFVNTMQVWDEEA